MIDLFGESNPAEIRRSAVLSDCGRYRYCLVRTWPGGSGICSFVMLNPSTADAEVDDPTIRRCIAFARTWGHAGIEVRNLYAFRSTDPDALARVDDPLGPECNRWLIGLRTADRVVAAWGAKAPLARERTALELMAGAPLCCLGLTRDGRPRHPLYVRGDAELVPFPTPAAPLPAPRGRG
jgi:hypothetical protein